MKQSFPYLPLLLVFALAAFASGQMAPPWPRAQRGDRSAAASGPGAALVRSAVARLHGHASVTARVRYRLEIFEEPLVGYGEYYQQGAGADLRIRLELQTQIEGVESSMQQIADGRYLWTDEQWGDEHDITRVSLYDVRRALESRAPSSDGAAMAQWAIGGLPMLLDSLANRFVFGAADPIMLGDLPAYAIVGRWRSEQFPAATADEQNSSSPTNLTEHVEPLPDEVLLVVAREDLFPHVVEFRRLRAESGGVVSRTTMVRLELYEVKIDALIDNRQFVFSSDATTMLNGTDRFLKENGLLEPETQ